MGKVLYRRDPTCVHFPQTVNNRQNQSLLSSPASVQKFIFKYEWNIYFDGRKADVPFLARIDCTFGLKEKSTQQHNLL